MPKYENLEKVKLSAYSCMRCGQCTGEVLADIGRDGVCPIKDHTPAFEPYMSRGKNLIVRALLDGTLEPSQELTEAIFKCSICNSCNTTCHQSNNPFINLPNSRHMDHGVVWEALRADLIAAGFKHLPGHETLLNSIKDYDNPWMQPRTARTRWTRKLDNSNLVDLSKDRVPVDVLLFVGCTAGLDANLQKVVISTARVLQKAGIKVGYLGASELCCGSIGYRVGEPKLALDLAKRNVELINSLSTELGIKTVVTACSGCFKTMFQEYHEHATEIGGELIPQVMHVTMYLSRLMEAGKLKFNQNPGIKKVTYHDPCHLGKHCKLYETPREILRNLPGVEFEEMPRNRENSWCCGAGGGVKSGFGDLSTKISYDRIREAEKTGASHLVTTCPFCEQNFSDGIIGIDSKLQVMDIVELVDKSI